MLFFKLEALRCENTYKAVGLMGALKMWIPGLQWVWESPYLQLSMRLQCHPKEAAESGCH